MNSLGRLFRISIYGESHGSQLGVLIDGCPAGLAITEDDFVKDIMRRKSGAKGTTPRKEEDSPILLSGVFNGYSTGAPIMIAFQNKNTRSSDYANLFTFPRPGHADFTGKMKYGGFNDYRGGGHFSGRLTLALVAAGVVAKKIIKSVNIEAKLIEAGGQKNIDKAIDYAIENNDSIGGIVECRAENISVGLGEPFFDSVESVLSHAVFAIPAIKGIEFGVGFKAASMFGSQHNDALIDISGKTHTNHAGGVNGGISNGNPLIFRVAVKPTSSIAKPQDTINLKSGNTESLKIEGRHDACIALRMPVVIEAVTAIVLTDFMMLEQKLDRIIPHD